MTEEVKEAKIIEENEDNNHEPIFENYKQRQRYYDEKYKNRGDVFFAQRGSSELFANGKVGTIKKVKGRTYRKEEK
jgi:hypothetical protein